MPGKDPRFEAYFEKSAEFARPILSELRARVHAACPQAEETLKWGAPSFTYQDKLLAVMAAFKQHVAFNLWHGAKVLGAAAESAEGMGQYGKLGSLKDLPGKRVMQAHIRKAMALIETGQTSGGTRSAKPKPAAEIPADLQAALNANTAAGATFKGFPPSKQRDYIDWIAEAKREDTRQRRLAQAVQWLAEGKARNWKYESC